MGISKNDFYSNKNVKESGVSLGHPIGEIGIMRLISLIYEMRGHRARYGLETI